MEYLNVDGGVVYVVAEGVWMGMWCMILRFALWMGCRSTLMWRCLGGWVGEKAFMNCTGSGVVHWENKDAVIGEDAFPDGVRME